VAHALGTSQTSSNPLNLVVPSFQLRAGWTYRFTLTGWMGSLPFSASSSIFNAASADVEILQSDLQAVILDGDRTVGNSADVLLLDGRQSTDPDNSATPMVYSWSCAVKGTSTTTPCVDIQGTPLFSSRSNSESTLMLAPTMMVVGVSHTITLTVSKIGVNQLPARTATDSIVTRVLEGQKPGIIMNFDSSMASDVNAMGEMRVNADSRFVVFGSVDNMTKTRLRDVAHFDIASITGDGPTASAAVCGMAWRWSWSSCSLSSSEACTPVTAEDAHLAAVASTQLSSAALVLRPNSLVPKTRYVFTLRAAESGVLTSSGRQTHRADASVTVVLNNPPLGGQVSVSPSVGQVLLTTFVATTSLWTDDATDLPLRYQFFYKQTGAGQTKSALSDITYSNIKNIATLPVGSGRVIALAIDRLGSEGHAETAVVVNPMATSSIENAANATRNLLQQAAAVSDPTLTMQTVSAAVSVLRGADDSQSSLGLVGQLLDGMSAASNLMERSSTTADQVRQNCCFCVHCISSRVAFH
jgi:hypothetical protein